jgi:hypothetical protein
VFSQKFHENLFSLFAKKANKRFRENFRETKIFRENFREKQKFLHNEISQKYVHFRLIFARMKKIVLFQPYPAVLNIRMTLS